MRPSLIPKYRRRTWLKAAGVTLALPILESLRPRTARGVEYSADRPRRMIAICNNLGVLPDRFFPHESGSDYAASPYLRELKAHRDQFTVLSGTSHPGVDGSHASDVSFLTAAPHPGSGGFRNSISLDQVMASAVGQETRFPSLALGVNVKQGRRSISWTDGGVLIPSEDSAAAVYRKLFLQGSERDIQRQIRRLKLGQSIMDALGAQAKTLSQQLNPRDRDRVDQFTTAVRDVERQMLTSQEWQRRPKPAASEPVPVDPHDRTAYMQKTQLMYRMAKLALETDSTRAITILLDSNNSPTIKVPGAQISDGYHNLSHHGRSENKLAQLEAIDINHMRLLSELFTELRGTAELGTNLLDQTMVLYGSNFGDANKHTTDNMPILIAGGGFRHGQHLAFDREQNYPLPNLFVSMLQQFGLEHDEFATSTGTMRGLEPTT